MSLRLKVYKRIQTIAQYVWWTAQSIDYLIDAAAYDYTTRQEHLARSVRDAEAAPEPRDLTPDERTPDEPTSDEKDTTT
jgi:hypothetical protein